MGKNRRAELDAKRRVWMELDAKRGVNKMGRTPSTATRTNAHRTIVGLVVNSKGKSVVGSRIYRTPTINNHLMSDSLLGHSDDIMQISDLFLPKQSVPLVARQAYRAKRKVTPSFVREAGAGDCIMDLFPGERIVPRMHGEPMVHERRVYRSPQHKGHTAWTYSVGQPEVVVDKRTNQPLVKQVIVFHECAGKLPPIQYVDTRARERAELDALVDVWRGKVNADLVDYLTRD